MTRSGLHPEPCLAPGSSQNANRSPRLNAQRARARRTLGTEHGPAWRRRGPATSCGFCPPNSSEFSSQASEVFGRQQPPPIVDGKRNHFCRHFATRGVRRPIYTPRSQPLPSACAPALPRQQHQPHPLRKTRNALIDFF